MLLLRACCVCARSGTRVQETSPSDNGNWYLAGMPKSEEEGIVVVVVVVVVIVVVVVVGITETGT